MKTRTFADAPIQENRLNRITEKIFRPFILDESADFIEKNINLARILVGLGIFHSYLDILGYSVFLTPESTSRVITVLVLSVLFTFGLFTPAVCALLIWNIAHPIVGYLGTMVLVTLLWGMFFAGVGRRWSLDAYLFKSAYTRKFIQYLHLFSLAPEPASFGKIRFLSLFLFWWLCVRAMFFHLDDTVWLSGNTLQLVFTTPYLTDHYQYFQKFSESFPRIYEIVCALALFIQSFWELLIIPLMYFAWGRIFVLVQGVAFFIASLFILNLGYLPYFEICMWIFLFNYPQCLHLKTGRLFYDDRCNLCKKTVLLIKAIDFYDRIEVQGFSKAPQNVQQVFSSDIQIVYQEKEDLLLGYNAYHRICTNIFPFCIMFPLFFLGKVTGLGPRAYHWVGQRRTQLFGVCEPFFYTSENRVSFKANPWASQIFGLFLITSLLITLYSQRVPLLGQAPVDVLNENDLRLGSPGIVLIETDENYEFQRTVPFMDLNGGRLNYLRNDLLYFRLSLQWQRQYAGLRNPNVLSNEFMDAYRKLAESVGVLDSCLRQTNGLRFYRADLYLKELKNNASFKSWGKPQKVASHSFSMDMNALKTSLPQCQNAYNLPPGHFHSESRIAMTDAHYTNP